MVVPNLANLAKRNVYDIYLANTIWQWCQSGSGATPDHIETIFQTARIQNFDSMQTDIRNQARPIGN